MFASSGRVGPTLAIRPGGRGNVTRTHLAWTSPKGSPFVPSPIVHGDQLYMVNDMASIVTSFEAATGKVLWQGRLGVAQREGFSASPVAVDGKVFFTNDQGETFVLRAGPDVRAAPHEQNRRIRRSRLPHSSTAAGTSGPIAAYSPSANNSVPSLGVGDWGLAISGVDSRQSTVASQTACEAARQQFQRTLLNSYNRADKDTRRRRDGT